jgi:hypothetical protein
MEDESFLPFWLACPIPPRISPHADELQHWLNGWVRRFGLPLDEPGFDRLARGGIARYASRLYPDASRADLRTIAALFTWFFLIDDACDSGRGVTPAQIGPLRDGVLRVLRVGPRSRPAGFAGPLRRMLVDAWRVPGQRMPPAWRNRFTDAVAHHLQGVLVEAQNKAIGHFPGVAEYVRLRRATSAAYVSHTLIEFTTGQPVPEAVYHHPLARELAATGNDLLSWFNDLVSLERDTATAGGHNLVLAMARQDGLPVDEAILAAARHWQQTMRRFVELRAAVPSFGPTVDGTLDRYLDGVADAVRGTIDWSLESARYRDTKIATILRSPAQWTADLS